MTTICYHAASKTMAADTQATSGNRKLRCSKVRQMADGGLLGGAGNWAHICKVQRWAEAGFTDKTRPDFGGDGAEFECLIVKGDGTIYLLDDQMELMPFSDGNFAIGSGGDYALAAMDCGKSPADAVRVASKFDAATSEPVEEWALAPKAKAKKRPTK